MDEQQNASLQERVERLETTVANLQRTMATMARTEGAARQPEQPHQPHQPRQTPAATPHAPLQVFCWNCRGGNPPDATICMWCGQPLSARGALRPPLQTASQPLPVIPPPPQPPSGRRVQTVQSVPAFPEPAGGIPLAAAALVQGRPDGGREGVPAVAPARPGYRPPRPAPAPSFQFNFDIMKRSEFWINKVGIGLLLLGLAFLFKYSADQGWLTAVLVPPVRVAIGLALGAVLLAFGLRLHGTRRYFSQVLMGGSVAAFYITGYAAYELLDLVPYWLAFGFMIGVTLLAFVLALGQNESILSLVGTTGALATPFVLATDAHGLVGLVAYTSLVLAGAAAVYFFRGWRSLIWTAYVGGWSVLAVAYIAYLTLWVFNQDPGDAQRWALQVGAICVLLSFWAIPVLREVLSTANPARWPYPAYPAGLQEGLRIATGVHVYSLAISATILTFFFTNLIWSIPSEARGAIAIGLCALYGLVAWALRRVHRNLAYMHMLLSLLFLTLGIALILHGQVLMLTLALEAAVLHAVSRRLSEPGLAISGHLVSLIVVLLLAGDLALSPIGVDQIFSLTALTQLAVIALLLAASTQVLPDEVAPVYRLLAHGAMVWWLWRELSPLAGGTGYVLIAWSLYALALLAISSTLVDRLAPSLARVARVARMLSDRTTPIVAHAIFVGVILWYGGRIGQGNFGVTPVINPSALQDVIVICILFAASFIVKPKEAVLAYRVAVHLAVLGWLARELSLLPDSLSAVMLSWAVYATLLHFLARRQHDRLQSLTTSIVSHTVFGMVTIFLAVLLLRVHPSDTPLLNPVALMEFAVIAMALVVSFSMERREEALVYRLVVHVAWLAWLWRELSAFENGNAYVTIAWGVYALGLLVAGVRLGRRRSLMYAGISTLFLVVAKLFLVDLGQVDPLIRTLLFLGFGGVFLVLSYYLQNLTRRPPEPNDQASDQGQ